MKHTKHLIAVLLLVLSGCATKAPEVVKVPVNVPCTAPEPSAPALSYAPGTYTQVFPMVKDLKADRELLLGYSGELLASLRACK